MTLREELAAEAKAPAGRPCLTCRWIGSQPPDQQPEWIDLMADVSIGLAGLQRFARTRGYPCSVGALRGHRDHP